MNEYAEILSDNLDLRLRNPDRLVFIKISLRLENVNYDHDSENESQS